MIQSRARTGSVRPKARPSRPARRASAVIDSFYFVHQALAGNGSITAGSATLHGSGPHQQVPPGFAPPPSTVPWAKAGLMIKASTKPGAAYAAVMLTGDHGVRMQYDFTHDVAGSAVSASWLRLTRSGDSITGYESADGRHWTAIGTAVLRGLQSHRAGRDVRRVAGVPGAVGTGDGSSQSRRRRPQLIVTSR